MAIFLVITMSSMSVLGQKAAKGIAKFQILIEINNDDLRLVSKDGCSWRELSFLLRHDQTQAINQFGMTSVEDEHPYNGKHAHFLFTILKSKNRLTFEGIKGVSWKTLSYDSKQENVRF